MPRAVARVHPFKTRTDLTSFEDAVTSIEVDVGDRVTGLGVTGSAHRARTDVTNPSRRLGQRDAVFRLGAAATFFGAGHGA